MDLAAICSKFDDFPLKEENHFDIFEHRKIKHVQERDYCNA